MSTRKKRSVELVDTLFFINVFLQRSGNRQLAEFGLNQSQFAVLREIVNHRDLAQKDLLGDFLLEKSNVSKIIKKLEQMELITVDVCIDDRRQMVLNATDGGVKLYHDCLERLGSMKEIFTEPLTDEEIEESLRVTRRLSEIVKAYRLENSGED